ncbi:MAG: excinuclease ABC subunit UvrB [Chloroflexi bacterium]|nr:excinuclease ABC subunit UvrB [Chloroflexota bacterium]MCY4246654.1 excinuclease ABC subunit UvrB [Chloroflexota bacterium]
MPEFELDAPFAPTGDQPAAIAGLLSGLASGHRHQTLLGATGTGKTFTIANVVQATQRPTLVMAHNKTLAAQLYAEFRRLFPNNAIEYFVSYYDYYQPEAYVPRHDLYIEKSTDINEQIERLRLSATASLFTRRDVLIVASVSCIYGIGDPVNWQKMSVELRVGEEVRRQRVLRDLVRIQYTRNDLELRRGTFRARGDTLEIVPGYSETAFRIYLWGDEIEKIVEFQPLTGEVARVHQQITVFPAREYITDDEHIREALHEIEQELDEQITRLKRADKLIEAQRIEQRTRYDIEMLREVGFTTGIENYSRHFDRRPPGSAPYTLIDYLPEDHLLVIDESHMTVPQIRGMFNGDRARKQVLVDYGFRLPSALDNRPLTFDEFWGRVGQTLYTSATPGPHEHEQAEQVVEQIIRPTGIVDPQIDVRPIEGQIENLLQEIALRVRRRQRALVTTLTQRMSEELAGYLNELGIRGQYLHAEVDTLERVEILRDLRSGVYDVVVGINLLREGLDLPEVSLVAVLDADKAGFLRSEPALIQTIGRAARHIEGSVIMYADKLTPAMAAAISETDRRRAKQEAYNLEHGIEPQQIVKDIQDLTDRVRAIQQEAAEEPATDSDWQGLPPEELQDMIDELENEMQKAAQALEFEKAAALRDQVFDLRGILLREHGIAADLALI